MVLEVLMVKNIQVLLALRVSPYLIINLGYHKTYFYIYILVESGINCLLSRKEFKFIFSKETSMNLPLI
jgi:hypothetical protein